MVPGEFHGSFDHTLDAKGRVSLPSKFRSTIGDRVWVTNGYDRCAWAMPQTAWEALLRRIAELPQSAESTRRVKRHIVGNAQECEIDKLGRILIPAPVREWAGIVKDVRLMGQIDTVEIWDRSAYRAYESSEKTGDGTESALVQSLRELNI